MLCHGGETPARRKSSLVLGWWPSLFSPTRSAKCCMDDGSVRRPPGACSDAYRLNKMSRPRERGHVACAASRARKWWPRGEAPAQHAERGVGGADARHTSMFSIA